MASQEHDAHRDRCPGRWYIMSHCVLSDWDLNVLDDGEEVAQRFGNRLHRQANQDCLV